MNDPSSLDQHEEEDLSGTDLAGGRYRLEEVLGRGGMGAVYRGRHTGLNKRVAIKVLGREHCKNEEQIERFVREAKAASLLEHENVVEIFDFGATPQGSVFIAMELLKGEDLADTIDREAPFTPARTKKIGLQICRALHTAHAKGVLHRDVKPENCFRTRRGGNRDFIKVLDFGVAKFSAEHRDHSTSLTLTGMVFGTPEYMSPEQASGGTLDARTDVYAVGVILYEMVTGTVPFSDEQPMRTLQRVVEEPPRPPSEVAPEARIPPELEKVILRALAKDPTRRFQSMRELAEALAAVPLPLTETGTLTGTGELRAQPPGSMVPLVPDTGMSPLLKASLAMNLVLALGLLALALS